MLCEKCHHCGLCEGDGLNAKNDASMRIVRSIILPFEPSEKDEFGLGIAIDIGTTTIVCASYSLCDEKQLSLVSQANKQRKYGSDVLSRIQFASNSPDGAKILHDTIALQINSLLSRLLSLTALKLSRGMRVQVSRVVVTGNTTMLSIALSKSLSSLSIAPFTPPSFFDMEVLYSDFIKDTKLPFSAIPLTTPLYFPPIISAFVGADTVCAMVATGFGLTSKPKMLADIGTNCEMAIQTKEGEIICTASSAGPAFEGGGVSFGMSATEGAIASSAIKDDTLGGKSIEYTVIGKGRAKGICGTGLLSVIHSFLELGLIDNYGTIQGENIEKILLRDGVSLLQDDIRSIQLAKAAVRTGLDYLSSYEKSEKNKSDMSLYLAGGFGTAVDISDVVSLGMIEPLLKDNAVAVGNAALAGSVAILLRDEYKMRAKEIAKKAKSVNLATIASFQDSFINNINF